MSDFTKKELEYLRWAIKYVRERTNNCGDSMRALLSKIELMINNYCDHEPSYVNHWPITCDKCGKELA